MKRLGLITIVFVAAACGPAPNLLPVDDLNRPTDVAFMCFGALPTGTGTDGGVADGGAPGPLQVTGRPMGACHPLNQYDPGPTSTTRTFAFLPNSAAGTLSVVDADHWKLVDLDIDTAGYGTAPLGQLPEQISASDDGCRLISANRGSCDLTLVDPSVLVAPVLSSQNGVDVPLASPRTGAQTFRPLKGDGTPLLAAPYEAVFLPQNTSSLLLPPASASLPYLQQQGPLCNSNSAAVDPNGWPAQPAPKSWYALVTYPSCDLITVVALPSGKIVSSAKVVPVRSSDGKHDTVALQDTGTSPVCPIAASDCAGQAIPPQNAAVSSDATVGDGPQHAAPGDAGGDAGVPDAAVDAGGTTGTDGAATGVGGSTGAGGASTGTGGASMGTGGAAGSTDAGATGGAQGGALLGNQFDNVPYVGTAPLGPSGIAIVPDGSRAYISLGNASYVLSIGLTSAGLSLPGNNIYLNEGARGSTRVRLSVDPTTSRSPGIAGGFVGVDKGHVSAEPGAPSNPNDPSPQNFAGLDPAREYLYVIARDGTLRVVSVFVPGAETECETNADPLHLAPGVSSATPCIPVDPAHRRPFSVGPGIHFSSLPIDIAAADIQKQPADTGEQSVNGAHAWVITDSGLVYLVNINPILRDHSAYYFDDKTGIYDSQPVTEPFPFINTLRDRNETTFQVTLDPSSGPPRVDVPPPVPPTGPYIEPFWTQGSAINPTAVTGAYIETSVFFPQVPSPPNPPSPNDPIDRRAITAQTWTVAWEGPLSGGRNSGKALPTTYGFSPFPGGGVSGTLAIDSLFQDGGINYCALGVVPGDMITLTGCTNNSQCGLGEQCVIGDTGSSVAAGLAVTGICVDPNREGTQIPACQSFLNSLRRYEIVAASPNNVIMRPHLDEIVLSSLTPPCQAAAGAGTDGGTSTDGGATPDTCPDTLNDPTTANFSCVSGDPITGAAPRCLMPCKTGADSECRAGRVCVDFGFDPKKASAPKCSTHECFCADAPPFDLTGKQCFDQLVNYQVVAGKSFIVAGSQAGIVTTANTQPSGLCEDPNPTHDPRFSFRIPLNGPNAPRCTNVPDSVATIDSRVDPDFVDPTATVQATMNAQALQMVATSTPAPNDPCLYLGGPVSGDPVSGADAGSPTQHVRALFKNSQVSFVLANVDRGPTFQFATTFDVHGGFAPQVVQDPATVQISMPARIVIGPVDSLPLVTTGTPPPQLYEAPYLFVVDQRRLGGSQGGGPTRGQLLRINPFGYTSTVGSTPTGYQPTFDDYNASGGLFPIQ